MSGDIAGSTQFTEANLPEYGRGNATRALFRERICLRCQKNEAVYLEDLLRSLARLLQTTKNGETMRTIHVDGNPVRISDDPEEPGDEFAAICYWAARQTVMWWEEGYLGCEIDEERHTKALGLIGQRRTV